MVVRTTGQSSPFTDNFDKLVQEALARYHVPGASFAVVQDNDSWCKAYGKAITNEKQDIDVKPDTLFYAASTTKAHLCAAWALYIASEVNQKKPFGKKISWSTPLAEIIREDFVLSDPIRTAQVTLEDAVSHRTGMPRHELAYGYEGVRTIKDLVRNLRHLPLHNEIRTTFEYCNTPFVAASLALETVTGKPLADYLREVLWKPLGMNHTYGGFEEASNACMGDQNLVIAKGYSWTKLCCEPDEADGQLIEEDYMDMPEVSGAGWAISCAEDYVRWMRAWLDPPSGPLTPEIIKEVWKARSIDTEDDHDNAPYEGDLTYGLGWFRTMYKGRRIYWHSGGLIGGGSYVMLCPILKFGVTFFANGPDVSVKLKGLAVESLDAALGISESERTGKELADATAMDAYRNYAKAYSEAKHKLYPHAPAEPIVWPSLHLGAYAGTFSAVGYGNISFTVNRDEDVLEGKLSGRTWQPQLVFQHVNAEYWLVTHSSAHSALKTARKAETKVGEDGELEAWGIAMESAMQDTLIWFKRA